MNLTKIASFACDEYIADSDGDDSVFMEDPVVFAFNSAGGDKRGKKGYASVGTKQKKGKKANRGVFGEAKDELDTGMKTLKFKIEINTPEYGKTLGLNIPDDSSDAGVASVQQEAVSEDAALVDAQDDVSYAPRMRSFDVGGSRMHCATPANKCRARNPLTCRYHGVQVFKNDIEGMIRAAFQRAGKQFTGEVNVRLLDINGQDATHLGIVSAAVSVTVAPEDAALVQEGMNEFGNVPGVRVETYADEDENTGDLSGEVTGSVHMDFDRLDPQQQARYRRDDLPEGEQAQQQDNRNRNSNAAAGEQEGVQEEQQQQEQAQQTSSQSEQSSGEDERSRLEGEIADIENKIRLRDESANYLRDAIERAPEMLRPELQSTLDGVVASREELASTLSEKRGRLEELDREEIRRAAEAAREAARQEAERVARERQSEEARQRVEQAQQAVDFAQGMLNSAPESLRPMAQQMLEQAQAGLREAQAGLQQDEQQRVPEQDQPESQGAPQNVPQQESPSPVGEADQPDPNDWHNLDSNTRAYWEARWINGRLDDRDVSDDQLEHINNLFGDDHPVFRDYLENYNLRHGLHLRDGRDVSINAGELPMDDDYRRRNGFPIPGEDDGRQYPNAQPDRTPVAGGGQQEERGGGVEPVTPQERVVAEAQQHESEQEVPSTPIESAYSAEGDTNAAATREIGEDKKNSLVAEFNRAAGEKSRLFAALREAGVSADDRENADAMKARRYSSYLGSLSHLVGRNGSHIDGKTPAAILEDAQNWVKQAFDTNRTLQDGIVQPGNQTTKYKRAKDAAKFIGSVLGANVSFDDRTGNMKVDWTDNPTPVNVNFDYIGNGGSRPSSEGSPSQSQNDNHEPEVSEQNNRGGSGSQSSAISVRPIDVNRIDANTVQAANSEVSRQGLDIAEANRNAATNASNIDSANVSLGLNTGHIRDIIRTKFDLERQARELTQANGGQPTEEAILLQNEAAALSTFTRRDGGMAQRDASGNLAQTRNGALQHMTGYLKNRIEGARSRGSAIETSKGVRGAKNAIVRMGHTLGYTPEFSDTGITFNWRDGTSTTVDFANAPEWRASNSRRNYPARGNGRHGSRGNEVIQQGQDVQQPGGQTVEQPQAQAQSDQQGFVARSDAARSLNNALGNVRDDRVRNLLERIRDRVNNG